MGQRSMDQRKQDFAELDFQQAEDLVHQRQRFQRRAKSATDLINYLLAGKGYIQTQSKTELAESWRIAVGQKWQAKTVVGNLRHGVLEVVVESSAAHQQLKFIKQQVLTSLQNQLPQNKIRDIRFRVGNIN
jgi:hypothetical protein